MQHKTFEVEIKADGGAGVFTALASVFGNVDLVGDRILKGAFSKTLAQWRAKGDPIPVVLSHQWDDPMAHIGYATPDDVQETDKGLVVKGKLDIHDNPIAKQVYRLMSERRLTGWSFGYSVPPGGEELGADGVNDIKEAELVEVGPTLKGANPEAQLQAIKSVARAAGKDADQLRHDLSNTVAAAQSWRAISKGDRHIAGGVVELPGPKPPPQDALDPDHIIPELEWLGAKSGLLKAVWTAAYVNDLPDSAFLYVEPGGTKDDEGKTTPRSLRHFPYKDANGEVDLPHLRNALARIPQSSLPQGVKDRLTARATELLDAAKSQLPDKLKSDLMQRAIDGLQTVTDNPETDKGAAGSADEPGPKASDPLGHEMEIARLNAALGKP